MSARLKFRAQPRIPGVKRRPRHTALIPLINDALEAIARIEGKTVSYVAAELIGDLIGIDAATGDPLERRETLRRYRMARRIFLAKRKK